ncbi:MAG TPA: ABC transporter permease subunit, partial [Longimicrobiales bacterium]|nr:ABC transporter permease subunit [Longimicrobiales bacterium]
AGPLPAFFGAVALILLIASEFTWRTARQNVIDGLSKGEFFLGKALAWPPVVLSFMLALLALVAVFGLAGSAGAGTAGPFIQAADLAHIGGLSVTALGYTSIAFFLAFLARSSGAAMGLFFLWIAFFEQILGKLLGLVGGVAASAAGFLPRAVFDRLIEREQYDAAARQAAVDAAVEAGRTAPEFLPTGLLVGASFAWVAVFVLLAFQVYRRRDL